MNFISLTYSLNTEHTTYDWVEFLNAFKALGDWHHPIEPMWLLCTELTVEEVYQKITKVADKCFEIYHITEFNPRNMHGCLLSQTWAWIKEKVDKVYGQS
jgi:hypothetical protein